MVFLGRLYPTPPDGQGTNEEKILAAYGGIFWGIGVGIALGAFIGVLYAVLVRRAKLREMAERQPPGHNASC
jgi:NhaP-type Na+/H+ or K+/H+ antiporter